MQAARLAPAGAVLDVHADINMAGGQSELAGVLLLLSCNSRHCPDGAEPAWQAALGSRNYKHWLSQPQWMPAAAPYIAAHAAYAWCCLLRCT